MRLGRRRPTESSGESASRNAYFLCLKPRAGPTGTATYRFHPSNSLRRVRSSPESIIDRSVAASRRNSVCEASDNRRSGRDVGSCRRSGLGSRRREEVLLCCGMPARDIHTNPRKVGLCADCQHARRIESDRGAVFFLCERALTDPRFQKYPRLPVVTCEGYEKAGESSQAGKAKGPNA